MRRVGLLRAVLVGLLVGIALVLGGATLGAGPAAAQTPTSVSVQECVPGATVPLGIERDGPAPVGRCEPAGGQRLADSLIWLFLVLVLVGLATGGVVVLVRSLRGAGVDSPADA